MSIYYRLFHADFYFQRAENNYQYYEIWSQIVKCCALQKSFHYERNLYFKFFPLCFFYGRRPIKYRNFLQTHIFMFDWLIFFVFNAWFTHFYTHCRHWGNISYETSEMPDIPINWFSLILLAFDSRSFRQCRIISPRAKTSTIQDVYRKYETHALKMY